MLHAREEQRGKSVELPRDLPGGPALRQVLDRALARDRNQRFTSARELAAALEAVPDQRELATMAIPLDGDVTLRPAPQTVRTAIPPPAPKSRSSLPLILVIGAVLLVSLAGIAAVVFWPKKEPVATTSEPPPQVAETTMAVVETTAEPEPEPKPAVVETTATVAPPQEVVVEPKPQPVRREPDPKPQPQPVAPERIADAEPVGEPAPPPAPANNVPVYVDGGGDDATNERMVEQLRREAVGVRKVELHGGAMQVELTRAMKEYFPGLEIGPGAPVVIRFEGVMERIGRGRKRRAATATITKNGRVVFRYQLPDEVFRVGMHPPEAFARVLSDAIMVDE